VKFKKSKIMAEPFLLPLVQLVVPKGFVFKQFEKDNQGELIIQVYLENGKSSASCQD